MKHHKKLSAKIVPLKDMVSYSMFIGKSNSYMAFIPPGSSMVLPRPRYPPESKHLIIYKYEKHFQKMYRDVGIAVPKTTETRCRDGSVQGRHVIQRLHN